MGLPLFLEDTTGYSTGPTNFYDIYDRPPFIHVENRVDMIERKTRVEVFELNVRHGSPLKRGITLSIQPGLEGYISFSNVNHKSGKIFNLSEWLYPVERSRMATKMSREFVATDGERYRWFYRSKGHEWTCVCVDTDAVVAHYDLKSVYEPKYRTSGNTLTVTESSQDLTLEFVASLILMRHFFSVGAFC